LGREVELERHVDDVLSQLAGHESVIREAAQEFGGCMQLGGYFYLTYPGLLLGAETVSKIAALGLKIDCDFNGLYSHRREDTA
jgi:hypothetical protein